VTPTAKNEVLYSVALNASPESHRERYLEPLRQFTSWRQYGGQCGP
jgi:hypothetical protein